MQHLRHDCPTRTISTGQRATGQPTTAATFSVPQTVAPPAVAALPFQFGPAPPRPPATVTPWQQQSNLGDGGRAASLLQRRIEAAILQRAEQSLGEAQHMQQEVAVQVAEHFLRLQLRASLTPSTPTSTGEATTAQHEQDPASAACRTSTETVWRQQQPQWWLPLPEQQPSQTRSSSASADEDDRQDPPRSDQMSPGAKPRKK